MNLNDLTDQIEEISSNYAKKYDVCRDGDWFVLKLQEELGELIQAYLMKTKQARQKGRTEEEIDYEFQKEVADVFCHVLLLARHFKVNLNSVVTDKWLSWSKPQ